MTPTKVRRLKNGDCFASADGRGFEIVTFNKTSGRGRDYRFIRTTRTDHNWRNDKVIEVLSDAEMAERGWKRR